MQERDAEGKEVYQNTADMISEIRRKCIEGRAGKC